MSERNETFECFAEEPKVYESEEEHFNDIFAGYEADHQKALALIVWQKEQIKNLEIAIKVYRSCLEHNNLDPKLYDAGYRKQSGWISVEERLPEREGTYLVYTYKGAIKFGDFRCYYAKNDNPQFDYYVTHWMPLPEAPKGGAE